MNELQNTTQPGSITQTVVRVKKITQTKKQTKQQQLFHTFLPNS